MIQLKRFSIFNSYSFCTSHTQSTSKFIEGITITSIIFNQKHYNQQSKIYSRILYTQAQC